MIVVIAKALFVSDPQGPDCNDNDELGCERC
jgi:hypothetical protein